MYRSWSYILMVAATLVGLVALVWPSPQVFSVAEESAPVQVRPAAPPRPEAGPAKLPKGGAKAAQKAAEQKSVEPEPVAKRVPPQNTTAKRLSPTIGGGVKANLPGKPGQEGAKPGMAPPRPGSNAKPGGANRPNPGLRPGAAARPAVPPRPAVGGGGVTRPSAPPGE